MAKPNLKFISASVLAFLLLSCDSDFFPSRSISTRNAVTTVSDIRTGGLRNVVFPYGSVIQHLVIKDTIDSRDFRAIADFMPNLKVLDLSQAHIAAYKGWEGAALTKQYYYKEDCIPDYAFYNSEMAKGMTSLSKVILPSSLRSIGNYAFLSCTALSDVVVDTGSLTDTVGKSAFAHCSQLANINLRNVRCIEESAFLNCSTLTAPTLNLDSVRSIKDWAFGACAALKNVNLPVVLNELSQTAFAGSGADISVSSDNPNFTSSSGVLFSPDKSILMHCSGSKSGAYHIPETVVDIAPYAFYQCKLLTTVHLPLSVSIIEDAAFYGCTGLSSFTISEAVVYIGANVFENCSNLSGFIITNNPLYDFSDGLLIDQGNSSVKFCLPTKTGSCVIPDGLNTIESAAFSNCTRLESVQIPVSINRFNARNFSNCSSLSTIKIFSKEPPSLKYATTAFDGVSFRNCTLVVPVGSKTKYQASEGWNQFHKIIEQ